MKRPSQYQHRATIWILVLFLSLAGTGCSDDEPIEPEPQEKAGTVPKPVVREWYPTPKHAQQPSSMFPMQQPMTARPGTLYQPAPAQQQPQVIIVQPAYQTPYAQPQQQAVPWPQPAYTPQQQYVPQYQPGYQPQFQYGQRPWGETGSYGPPVVDSNRHSVCPTGRHKSLLAVPIPAGAYRPRVTFRLTLTPGVSGDHPRWRGAGRARRCEKMLDVLAAGMLCSNVPSCAANGF